MTPRHSKIGFHRLRVCDMGRGPATRPAGNLESFMMAEFDLSMDVGFLFPYLNAVVKEAQLYKDPSYIRFGFEGKLCALYPKWGIASPFDDNVAAREFMTRFTDFLNGVSGRRDGITPRYKFFTPADITQILKLLPQTNCSDCGFNTCLAFAAMLARQQTIPGRCPHISRPVEEKAIYPVLDENGKLLSTISLDIDNTRSEDDLASARKYIQSLEKKIESLSRMKGDLQTEANKRLPTPLSKREIEVLRMLACGTTNAEIGQLLHISPHTVKSHIDHIFNKLSVNSRTQASVWATQNHFV